MFPKIHWRGIRLPSPRGRLAGFLVASVLLLPGPVLSGAQPMEVTEPDQPI